MNNLSRRVRLGAALVLTGFGHSALADKADNNASLHGILAGTYQAATESKVDGQNVTGEPNGELYLMGTLNMGPGAWHLEVRGSTTPIDHGVTQYYASNASVGETTDSDGDGRIAATQFFYELPVGTGEFRAGLLDPTAVSDNNSIMNTEYTQFLADAFVNNPTIGFPSFVLGGAYRANATEHLEYRLFVGSDSGLQGDDPTYDNVFDVGGNRGSYDKGVFTLVELDWHAQEYTFQTGVWYDSGNVARLGRSSGDANGYGAYVSGTMPFGSGHLQGRAGIANDKAQAAANFVSLGYQLPIKVSTHGTTLGVAVARTGDSDHLNFDSDPIYQAEAYWRINVAGPFYVSPDIQYIDNAGFQSDHDGAVVGGARAGIEF